MFNCSKGRLRIQIKKGTTKAINWFSLLSAEDDDPCQDFGNLPEDCGCTIDADCQSGKCHNYICVSLKRDERFPDYFVYDMNDKHYFF